MDRRTREKLITLGLEMQDKFRPWFNQEEKPDQFDVEMIGRMTTAMNKAEDPRVKEAIRVAMETNHRLEKKMKELTAQQELEIRRWYETKIKKMIKNGELPPPSKSDDFRKSLGL